MKGQGRCFLLMTYYTQDLETILRLSADVVIDNGRELDYNNIGVLFSVLRGS